MANPAPDPRSGASHPRYRSSGGAYSSRTRLWAQGQGRSRHGRRWPLHHDLRCVVTMSPRSKRIGLLASERRSLRSPPPDGGPAREEGPGAALLASLGRRSVSSHHMASPYAARTQSEAALPEKSGEMQALSRNPSHPSNPPSPLTTRWLDRAKSEMATAARPSSSRPPACLP